MLTQADVRNMILTHKWDTSGRVFDVDYIQEEIQKIANRKGLVPPRQPWETTTMVDKLVPEVIWELLVRGVFVPGRVGFPNESLPRLTITSYGEECMRAGELTPNDPEGYLKRIKAESPSVGSITLMYLGEALQTFKFGNYLATAVMVGVAAESVLHELIDAVAANLDTSAKQKRFTDAIRKSKNAKDHHLEIMARFTNPTTQLPGELKDLIDQHINGMFNIIRRTRNAAGHPLGPNPDRIEVQGTLFMFPCYCKTAHQLIDWLGKNKI